jgi:hypothetical protein
MVEKKIFGLYKLLWVNFVWNNPQGKIELLSAYDCYYSEAKILILLSNVGSRYECV